MIDIKELKKLVKYLRKEGITEFKDGTLELRLELQPKRISKHKTKVDVSDQVNEVPTDEPTREELLFWSAGESEPIKES